MHNNARGGDPVSLGSCLSGLEDKQQFDTWSSMAQLGMLDGYEITYDTGLGGFRLVAPVESKRTDESA